MGIVALPSLTFQGETVVYCTACGAALDADDRLCPSCNAPAQAEMPEAAAPDAEVMGYARAKTPVEPDGQEASNGQTEARRFCKNCGTRLNPKDRTCPVCAVRRAAGRQLDADEAAEAAAIRKAPRPRLRLPLPSRRVVLLATLLVILLLGALAGAYYYLNAAEAPSASPAERSQQAGAQPTAGTGGQEQPTGARGTPVATLSPAAARATAASVAARAGPAVTPTPSLRPVPFLPRVDLSEAGIAGHWSGFLTIRRVSPTGGSSQEKEADRAPQQDPRSEPRVLVADFAPRSRDAGTVTVATEKPPGEAARGEQGTPTLDFALDSTTATYNYQEGWLIFRIGESTLFEGQIGRGEGRYLMEGTWQVTVPSPSREPGSPGLLIEGTWTLAR